MANFRPNMNRTPEQYPCACVDKEGMIYFQGYVANQNDCAQKCAELKPRTTAGGGDVSVSSMRKATGTSFQRRRKGGTGQPVNWKNQSGTILGYTTQQVLIAVGVGVAAYFLYKKFK